ncbi:MAG: hypothetical protein LBT89_12380 [Planctomycetaceae bacterium]|jgi:hypothetical protein|nr:hypothetical protein [Planctomycetaceae bacterium]
MKGAYKKYRDKGLEIVSVYILDKLEASKKCGRERKIAVDYRFGRTDESRGG